MLAGIKDRRLEGVFFYLFKLVWAFKMLTSDFFNSGQSPQIQYNFNFSCFKWQHEVLKGLVSDFCLLVYIT